MAMFDRVHWSRMQPRHALRPGEMWTLAVREPLPLPYEPASATATVTVVQLLAVRLPDGGTVMRPTPQSEKVIADWNARHRDTPEEAFGLPVGLGR
jgi:hypothetical protein